jgi:hypothetical protein
MHQEHHVNSFSPIFSRFPRKHGEFLLMFLTFVVIVENGFSHETDNACPGGFLRTCFDVRHDDQIDGLTPRTHRIDFRAIADKENNNQ